MESVVEELLTYTGSDVDGVNLDELRMQIAPLGRELARARARFTEAAKPREERDGA